MKTSDKRWSIAFAGTALQLLLGTVYAWSFFQKPLAAQFGWSNSQVAWTFSTAIFMLGVSAAWGGLNLPKYGPRKLAVTGGFLFGLGYLVSSYALKIHSLPLLYAGYGVIGGIGLGLGYVTPVATAAKWFPDKKGFVTGMVVMGFGLGALLMSKVLAPMLLEKFDGNLVNVFALLGAVFMICAMAVGSILKNPPDYASSNVNVTEKADFSVFKSSKFIIIWLIFFFNICAGISIISFQSPLLQDLLHALKPQLGTAELAAAGAMLIGVSSLFNGLGRFFWGAMSDRIGNIKVFRVMFLSQIVAFLILMNVKNGWMFSGAVCYILLCYGGGFGSMPSFISNVFGAKRMALVYGAVLTAWSMGGIAGPQIAAIVRDRATSDSAGYITFAVSAVMLAAGFLCTLINLESEK